MERVIAIDVSTGRLEVYRLEDGRRLAITKDAAGVGQLADRLDRGARDLLVMEASGGYERLAHRLLSKRGRRGAIVNRARGSAFARARGRWAKTDRVDAAVSARARQGRRPIRGGRGTVRVPLYMAALVASRSNPTFRAVYQRLLAQAKPPKRALVVLMRTMLVTLNAMLRTSTPWRQLPTAP